MKPKVRIEAGMFVAYLEGQPFRLGKISNGIAPAIRNIIAFESQRTRLFANANMTT
jgi:hypothetical protein